jgi:hypothetical protein
MSERKEILHNIDDKYKIASLTVKEWKLLKGDCFQFYSDLFYSMILFKGLLIKVHGINGMVHQDVMVHIIFHS